MVGCRWQTQAVNNFRQFGVHFSAQKVGKLDSLAVEEHQEGWTITFWEKLQCVQLMTGRLVSKYSEIRCPILGERGLSSKRHKKEVVFI